MSSPLDPGAAISVRGLVKRYGDRNAVDGVDLDIRRGEIFALLGPNGAGKTTTVEILEGYRTRDGGQVQVLGQDPAEGGRSWRAEIGIVLQSGAGDSQLTCLELLTAQAAYYPDPRDPAEVLELVGLTEKARARGRSLSGGQRRRLDVALGIVGRPALLFLDEPTTGFDPEARRQFWSLIRSLRDLGTTMLLTTHYLDEARSSPTGSASSPPAGWSRSPSPPSWAAGGTRRRWSAGPRTAHAAARTPRRRPRWSPSSPPASPARCPTSPWRARPWKTCTCR